MTIGTSEKFAWHPPKEHHSNSKEARFIAELGAGDFDGMNALARDDPGRFWDAVIRFCGIPFMKDYERILDSSLGPAWTKWCVGGRTNLAHICLDRWRGTPAWDREVLVWEGEDGSVRSFTYASFSADVSRAASGLRQRGVGKGDVVALYMPLVPEALVAYFAVVKLGAIVMPLFSGYGAKAVAQRLRIADAKALVTADGTRRRGQVVDMLSVAEKAVSGMDDMLLCVVSNLGERDRDEDGNSVGWDSLLEGQDPDLATVEMEADAPCALHFSSGTTGIPKACVYTHVGPAVKMALDHGILNGFSGDDRHFCMADMGWMVGTKMTVLPTVHGGSLLIAEGSPDHPDPGRFWRLMEEHQATFAELSPSLVRLMMAHGDDVVAGRDFGRLRGLITGGEPWTDSAWNWLFDKVCGRKVPIYDSAGGTEVSGSILICDMLHPIKVGSFSVAVPGMGAGVALSDGKPAAVGETGELVMEASSIGLTQGLWGDPKRYEREYWSKIPGLWVHGDLASRDEDGCWKLHGRSDDTFKVSGKRVGPAEVESAVMDTGMFREVAAVSRPDAVRGSALVLLCVALDPSADGETLGELAREQVVTELGKAFQPDEVLVVGDLPKTRNGKIMRRAARAALLGQALDDPAPLSNPEAMDAIAALARGGRDTVAAKEAMPT